MVIDVDVAARRSRSRPPRSPRPGSCPHRWPSPRRRRRASAAPRAAARQKDADRWSVRRLRAPAPGTAACPRTRPGPRSSSSLAALVSCSSSSPAALSSNSAAPFTSESDRASIRARWWPPVASRTCCSRGPVWRWTSSAHVHGTRTRRLPLSVTPNRIARSAPGRCPSGSSQSRGYLARMEMFTPTLDWSDRARDVAGVDRQRLADHRGGVHDGDPGPARPVHHRGAGSSGGSPADTSSAATA